MLSIILVTVDRPLATERFLLSLTHQTCEDFEVVLMYAPGLDPAVAEGMCRKFPGLRIRAYPSPDTCLSRSRNAGLARIKGDCFAIADDDCVYTPEVSARVLTAFRHHPGLGVLMGSSLSLDPGPLPEGEKPLPLPEWRLFTGCPSYVQFYRSAVAAKIIGFDESMGVGSGTPWQSGEETDFALRAVDAGFAAARVPSVIILHPAALPAGASARRKLRAYARGRMWLLRKHRCSRAFVALNVLYPLLALPLECARMVARRTRYRLAMFAARFLSLWRP